MACMTIRPFACNLRTQLKVSQGPCKDSLNILVLAGCDPRASHEVEVALKRVCGPSTLLQEQPYKETAEIFWFLYSYNVHVTR